MVLSTEYWSHKMNTQKDKYEIFIASSEARDEVFIEFWLLNKNDEHDQSCLGEIYKENGEIKIVLFNKPNENHWTLDYDDFIKMLIHCRRRLYPKEDYMPEV